MTWQYTNITSATTNLIGGKDTILMSITVNKGVASATITVYDNTAGSGNKIATIAADNPGTFFYGVRCRTGLTVVTSGANDVTVNYL
jgi:hypothetical protein